MFLTECSSSSPGLLSAAGGGLPHQPGAPSSLCLDFKGRGWPTSLHRGLEQRNDQSLCGPERPLHFCLPYGFSASSVPSPSAPGLALVGLSQDPLAAKGQALKIHLVLPGSGFLPLRPAPHRVLGGLTLGYHDSPG